MKLLHTSDWHVGKTIRGRSRAEEHSGVLAEIAAIAEREAVGAVLVAGDLFDAAAPQAESERIVYEALLALSAERTRPVVVIAGNHDSAQRFAAVAPVFRAHGVHVLAHPCRPGDGGVLELDGLRVALLPFPSQRSVLTADALMQNDAADLGGSYAERVRRIIDTLCATFSDDAVNIVLAHLMVMGGTLGGGERGAHTIFDYWVPATSFPVSAHYVALGHLHRAQLIDGPSPLRYCGSPLQLDFGETANEPSVNLVTAEPGRPGVEVEAVALSRGRRLRSLRGTPEALLAEEGLTGDDHLRLVVDSGPRPGLADELRERFPTAVEVVLAAPGSSPRPAGDEPAERRTDRGRSPHDLVSEYLQSCDAHDERVLALFDEIVEEMASEAAPA